MPQQPLSERRAEMPRQPLSERRAETTADVDGCFDLIPQFGLEASDSDVPLPCSGSDAACRIEVDNGCYDDELFAAMPLEDPRLLIWKYWLAASNNFKHMQDLANQIADRLSAAFALKITSECAVALHYVDGKYAALAATNLEALTDSEAKGFLAHDEAEAEKYILRSHVITDEIKSKLGLNGDA